MDAACRSGNIEYNIINFISGLQIPIGGLIEWLEGFFEGLCVPKRN